MKKKLLIICILGIMAIVAIYYITINNKVKLLTLGDGLASGMTAYNVNGYSYADYLKDYYKKDNHLQSYNNIFAEINITSKSLLESLNNNITGTLNEKEITIQQAISSSNVIVLAIGLDELANKSLDKKITNQDLNEYYSNLKNILKKIRKINHEKVIVLGIYKAFNLTNAEEINNNIKDISKKYNCDFIDISKVINNENYYFNDTSYYINYKGHKKISEELIKLV